MGGNRRFTPSAILSEERMQERSRYGTRKTLHPLQTPLGEKRRLLSLRRPARALREWKNREEGQRRKKKRTQSFVRAGGMKFRPNDKTLHFNLAKERVYTWTQNPENRRKEDHKFIPNSAAGGNS